MIGRGISRPPAAGSALGACFPGLLRRPGLIQVGLRPLKPLLFKPKNLKFELCQNVFSINALNSGRTCASNGKFPPKQKSGEIMNQSHKFESGLDSYPVLDLILHPTINKVSLFFLEKHQNHHFRSPTLEN